MRAAATIVSVVVKSPAVQGVVLRKIGRDPMERALASALSVTVAELEKKHPGWVAGMFDESFLTREAAPVFARVITRGDEASPTELARLYVVSLGPNREPQRSIRRAERVAADVLVSFTGAVQREPALRELLDSKALDSIAAGVKDISEAISAGRLTEVSHPGFRGGPEARMIVLVEGRRAFDGCSEEVPG